MEEQQIDSAYLRAFFDIPPGKEGDAELQEIRKKLIRLQFRHGQDICAIDSEADGVYFLESGTAVVLDREGQQINIMREGQYFGEYAVLSGQRRLSTVRSLGTTVVYRLSNEDTMEILRRHPSVYGELMKRVYAQVTQKHRQLISLSRMHRRVLQHPDSQTPLTPRRMLIQYGALVLIFVLSLILIPENSTAPVFLFPLLLMVVYALITHQTLESLIVAGMYAALLIWRRGAVMSYTDALLETLKTEDSVYTTFVLVLLGGFVSLIEASGAVTAFQKLVSRKVTTARGARLAMLGILAVTSVDDGLSLLCASAGTNSAADEQRIPCEDRALMLSFLPVVLCSFVPLSIWGVFVIGTISPVADGSVFRLFVSSIPFNFFSIVVVIAMLLLCFDRLPRSKALRKANERVKNGGELWPDGSEPYLLQEEGEVWGRIGNLLLPILVLAVGSLTLRSISGGSFAVDSLYGLAAALVFMFILYCGQALMSPEQYFQHFLRGIQDMALPIILYILTMCLTTLLNHQAMDDYYDGVVTVLQRVQPLLPAALFLVSTLLAMALGSSWAMYAISFPIITQLAGALGVHVPLCVGAICAAGLAGEYCCLFTSDHLFIGEAIGCDPNAVRSVRIPYAVCFTAISLLLYLAAGFLMHIS